MSTLFLNTYNGRKVLVTGHTGFKGSWLTLWLNNLGANVLGYSLAPPTDPNLFKALNLRREIHHIKGDIRNAKRFSKAIEEFEPEIIFHLAAQPLVRLSYEDPIRTYETNIMGTLNLFESVRKVPSARVLVNVTSDKCYENREWVFGYRENDPMGGYDPYSSSKGCAELVTSAYRRSFFHPDEYGKSHTVALASVRAGNVIGGGDFADDRLLPDCIDSLASGRDIVIRNPKAVRPWQFVLEPLSGYLWLGALLYREGPAYAEAWNFGPGSDDDVLTVEELARTVAKLWGKGTVRSGRGKHPHEAKLLKLDTSKSIALLKWKPAYDILRSIDVTTSWYRTFFGKNEDMRHYSAAQISHYVATARKKNIPWSKPHESG